jgi:hypothetical protein
MLDLAKIQLIAQSYSPQELFAALVWFAAEAPIEGAIGRSVMG